MKHLSLTLLSLLLLSKAYCQSNDKFRIAQSSAHTTFISKEHIDPSKRPALILEIETPPTTKQETGRSYQPKVNETENFLSINDGSSFVSLVYKESCELIFLKLHSISEIKTSELLLIDGSGIVVIKKEFESEVNKTRIEKEISTFSLQDGPYMLVVKLNGEVVSTQNIVKKSA